MIPLSRRHFIALSGTAATAAALSPLSARAADTPASPAATSLPVGPFHQAGAARLRLSLAAYSFREQFPFSRRKPNTKPIVGKPMDMFAFVDYCAAQGLEGAELTSYYFSEESDDYFRRLKRHCFLRGVSVSGTAIGNNFSLPAGAALDEEIATTQQWIDRAAVLGAPHIRVFAGVEKGIARAAADQSVIRSLEAVSAYAGQRGIFLGLENHDSIGSAAALLPMVKAVNSPWLGINLDSGNFRTADPYRDFAECLPYAVNVQIKTEVIKDGAKVPADLPKLVRLIRESGYRGWVALEYEGKEDAAVAVPRTLGQLKSLTA